MKFRYLRNITFLISRHHSQTIRKKGGAMFKRVLFVTLMFWTISGIASAQSPRSDSSLIRKFMNDAREMCFSSLRGRETSVRNDSSSRIIEASENHINYETVSVTPSGELRRIRIDFSCNVIREGESVSSVVRETLPFVSEALTSAVADEFCRSAIRYISHLVSADTNLRTLEASETRLLVLRRGVVGGEWSQWTEQATCGGRREGELTVISTIIKWAPFISTR